MLPCLPWRRLHLVFSGAARQAKNSAALLAAATGHLGSLLADLYVAMPTLASCGFVSSMAAKSKKHSSLLSNSRGLLQVKAADDASVAVAAISKKLGVDEQGLAALLSDARSALDAIPR